MILIHGTTRRRARQILDLGPAPQFREPGGQATEDDISMYLESGPFHLSGPPTRRRGDGRRTLNQALQQAAAAIPP
jgi:hypothetical protein